MNVYVPSQNEIVILKQPIVAVLSNSGASASNHTVPVTSAASGWAANTVLLDAVQCGTYTTDSSGNLAATISGGNPLILIEKSKAGSICDGYVAFPSGTSTSSASPSATSTKSAAGKMDVAMGSVGLGAVAGLMGLLL